MEEIWKDVLGYEGCYMVSNLGMVKSLSRYVKGRSNSLKPLSERILKPAIRKGYHFVVLSKNNHSKNCNIHRLVWEAFNGPIPECMQVNHINEDKTDNRLENLNLLTSGDNIRWGTCIIRGAKNRSKRLLQYDLEGNLLNTWNSAVEYANMMKDKHNINVSRGHISSCCKGKEKTAYGFVWKYAS